MSDDFFKKIDAKLGERKVAKAAADTASEVNLAFVKEVIPRLVAIAESYAAKCRERGMSAEVSHSDYSITFTLRYGSGEKRLLIGGPDHDRTNKLSFEDHYPNDDGKRYRSLPTEWFDAESWSDDRYVARLEKTIEDFVFYADRHKGL